jgi:hypothetical protein
LLAALLNHLSAFLCFHYSPTLRDGEAFAEWIEAMLIRGFVGAGAHVPSDLVETTGRGGNRRWMILEHTIDGLK